MNNNVFRQRGKLTYEKRCNFLKQQGLVIWFTGLSGSGKSTIASQVELELMNRNKYAYILDGDNIRLGLNSDLKFSMKDRIENNRRIAEVAALFKDAGLIVLVCCISPSEKMREFAKQKVGKSNYIEIFVKADIQTCINRDPKNLYKKAKMGEIKDFTGISSPYEEPKNPDLIIDTTKLSISESAQKVIDLIIKKVSFGHSARGT